MEYFILQNIEISKVYHIGLRIYRNRTSDLVAKTQFPHLISTFLIKNTFLNVTFNLTGLETKSDLKIKPVRLSEVTKYHPLTRNIG